MKREGKTTKLRAHAAPRLLRAVSLHEMAVLLLLASAPVEATAGTPDYLGPQGDGLGDVVDTRFALSDSGKATRSPHQPGNDYGDDSYARVGLLCDRGSQTAGLSRTSGPRVGIRTNLLTRRHAQRSMTSWIRLASSACSPMTTTCRPRHSRSGMQRSSVSLSVAANTRRSREAASCGLPSTGADTYC